MQRKEDSDKIKQYITENHISPWNIKCFPFDLKFKIKFAFCLTEFIFGVLAS